MADFNVCECKCHDENGPLVKHVVACCYTCETCNQRIKSHFSYAHERACKKEHCQHNWVMDGHNAGDPICSKCYARE
jgi:hypothetical protein